MALTTLIERLQLQANNATASIQPDGGGYAINNFIQPGETLAQNGTAIFARALASTYNRIFIPAESDLVVDLSASNAGLITGRTLCGPGKIRLTKGNLRAGSGSQFIGLNIEGENKTNQGSGISVQAGANDVVIVKSRFRQLHHNGININPGVSNIRIFENDISEIGGVGINKAYQGCGIYASGETGTGCLGLEVVNNNIGRTYGQGAIFIHAVDDFSLFLNRMSETWGARGVHHRNATERIEGARSKQLCSFHRGHPS